MSGTTTSARSRASHARPAGLPTFRPLVGAALLALSVLLVACAGDPAPETHPSPSPGSLASPQSSATVVPADRGAFVTSNQSWTFNRRAGRMITTPHYRLYTTLEDAFVLERMPAFLERAVQHYSESLGPLGLPSATMETYMMRDKEEWKALTRHFLGDEAGVALKIPRGGFAYNGRALLYDIGRQDTFAISAHEGWHQFSQRVFKESLPIWLEEGVATYMEGFRWDPSDDSLPHFLGWANQQRHKALRDNVHALFPLRALLSTSPARLMEGSGEDSLIYYAQVWALVHFLREGGGGRYADGLARVLADARDGTISTRIAGSLGEKASRNYKLLRNGPEVFETYFTQDLDSAQREYTQFVLRITAVGSGNGLPMGVSPLDPGPGQ